MKLFQRFFCVVICILVASMDICGIHADENMYSVYEPGGEYVEFGNYSSALSYYQSVNNDNNLILKNDDNVLLMKYGTIEFLNSTSIYYSFSKNRQVEIRTSMSADALFLRREGEYIYFLLNGDYGRIKADKVRLWPYEEIGHRITSYTRRNGILYLNIKTSYDNDYFTYQIPVDYAPEYIKDNTVYFSFDGHYFYDDFKTMSSDVIRGKYDNALNKEAYYNYYDYVPYRSVSSYETKELEDYFYKTLLLQNRLNNYRDVNNDKANDTVNRSEYYNNIKYFLDSSYLYGANVMMLLSSSILDSSYGKSYEAYVNNQLFDLIAYETNEEKENNRYNSIEDSINAYAKYYVSDVFANYLRRDYSGMYFGDLGGGIGSSYYKDPYYGNKAASQYFLLDKALGNKDKGNYTIGLIENADRIYVYEDRELNNRLITLNGVSNYVFIILEESDDYYRIQLDSSFNDEYHYDFINNTAYIKKNNVQIINCGYKDNSDLVKVNYNFDGGEYYRNDTISLYQKENTLLFTPVKNGYDFIGYERNGDTLKALYKKIKEIKAVKEEDVTQYVNEPLNLMGIRLFVMYEDGGTNVINLNSDMTDVPFIDEEGKCDLLIKYNGLEILYQMDVKTKTDVDELINSNIDSYINKGTYNIDELRFIKNNISDFKNISISKIRLLDSMMMEQDNNSYYLSSNSKDISVSGMSLSLGDNKETVFDDTYYVYLKDASSSGKIRLSKIAENYGFKVMGMYNISFSYNYHKLNPEIPVVVQMDVYDSINKNYSVYYLKGEDILKAKTEISKDHIYFTIDEPGDFAVLVIDSFNSYQIDDHKENINSENVAYDALKLMSESMIIAVLSILCMINFVVISILNNRKEKIWNDFRKSLPTAVTVQEEKLKS